MSAVFRSRWSANSTVRRRRSGGQTLGVYLPGVNQDVTIPCQSYGLPLPFNVMVRPPTGVIAGYLGVWANGTAPGYAIDWTNPLGPVYDWTTRPSATASWVSVELWKPPTQQNPWGTYYGSSGRLLL